MILPLTAFIKLLTIKKKIYCVKYTYVILYVLNTSLFEVILLGFARCRVCRCRVCEVPKCPVFLLKYWAAVCLVTHEGGKYRREVELDDA